MDINLRSVVLKIVPLLPAFSLLSAVLYYQRVIHKPVQPPVRPDSATVTFPPPKT